MQGREVVEGYLYYNEWSNIDWDSCRKEHLLGGKVKSFRELPPQQQYVKNEIEKICKIESIAFHIYLLNTTQGKLKAKRRGIQAPAVMVLRGERRQVMDITDSTTSDQLKEFILGSKSPTVPSKTHKLNGKTIIDVPGFACTECGSHQFKIMRDYSGFCAKCGKVYMKITLG